MKIEISDNFLESMRKIGLIIDYTDDGFVYREDSGWVPAGDVVEFYLGMEEYELKKAEDKVREAQART